MSLSPLPNTNGTVPPNERRSRRTGRRGLSAVGRDERRHDVALRDAGPERDEAAAGAADGVVAAAERQLEPVAVAGDEGLVAERAAEGISCFGAVRGGATGQDERTVRRHLAAVAEADDENVRDDRVLPGVVTAQSSADGLAP
jgi:hypothetical protein